MLKLRRLLLRFDPPGLGLEYVDCDEGCIDVRHKSLPSKEEIHLSGDVYRLAFELVRSELELLTEKHWGALVQQLARLYGISIYEAALLKFPTNAVVTPVAPGRNSESSQHPKDPRSRKSFGRRIIQSQSTDSPEDAKLPSPRAEYVEDAQRLAKDTPEPSPTPEYAVDQDEHRSPAISGGA